MPYGLDLNIGQLNNRVVVTSAIDLSGVLDSTKEYFLDGIIDMGNQSIEVPSGGLQLAGFSFDTSKLVSSEDNYTMFTSPVGGSGNLLGKDYAIEVTGTNSQVYDLFSVTGFEAFEFARINYNDCSSLGEIDNYRQGLETGTGRFGGTPELTLSGTWVGGFFIETSIVRSLVDGAYSLFKAGTAFSMSSRFRSNQNIDLNSTINFFDFSPSNFPNANTVQLDGCLVSRNGIFDATDTTVIPNMDRGDIAAYWKGNTGIRNTFVGGRLTVDAESATVIAAGSTFYDLNATWGTNSLQHFTESSNGVLQHNGINPIEFNLVADLLIESTANNVLEIRWGKYDDETSSWSYFGNQARQVNSLVGGRDVAFFNMINSVSLNQGDRIKLQVANNNGNNNATVELDSYFLASER